MKLFIGLARVSSREQEREGFSLEIQEDALLNYADKAGGTIEKLFRIAETASKSDERTTFRAMIDYARKNAHRLDGILFYKIDRASRNLFDYVELERLESDQGLPFISISQPTENTPTGRMMRRTLANMASFYTEQQSVDVREGIARRVEEGWFPSRPPFGYRNVRHDGRGMVEVHPENGPKVRRVFFLYAYHHLTIDDLAERLFSEGVFYSASSPKFPRSSLHAMLRDRSYLGEIDFRGQWFPGKHEPLVDLTTWDRVQVLLGGHVYNSHEMTYASELITCGHCGGAITGEKKTKQTKAGEREYFYYRCSKYSTEGHPRTRLTEKEVDQQVLALFDRLRIDDEKVRDWVVRMLRSRTKDQQDQARSWRSELHRQLTLAINQQDRLLNLRLHEEVDADTFATKQTELRDRVARLKLQIDASDRTHDENADIAIKAFELSQNLRAKWLTADFVAKRRILEILCLNWTLNGVSLVPEMRKPFDLLVEGLVSEESRGDKI
jgi:DNA invertase Pin-like site-specific DNA recombinase